MVALEIILDRELPVRLDGVEFAMRDPGVRPAVRRIGRVQRRLDGTEVERSLRERDQHQSFDDAQMDGLEAMGRGVEFGGHEAG